MSFFFFFCSLSLHHTSCVGQTFNRFYSFLAAVVFYLLKSNFHSLLALWGLSKECQQQSLVSLHLVGSL